MIALATAQLEGNSGILHLSFLINIDADFDPENPLSLKAFDDFNGWADQHYREEYDRVQPQRSVG